MLEKDPRKRIALSEAIKHPLFTEEHAKVVKNVKVKKRDIVKSLNS